MTQLDLDAIQARYTPADEDITALVAEVERLRYQLGEARLLVEGHERIEERISRHIPEHYEAGYNPLEDWAKDAFEVVRHAHCWRKTRSDDDAAKLDAAVEKIYPSEDYL